MLTQSEMNVSLGDVCAVRSWSTSGIIDDTNKDAAGIAQDVNDYLRRVGDFSNITPSVGAPPINIDGEANPPIGDLKKTDPIKDVTDAFVGLVIETN